MTENHRQDRQVLEAELIRVDRRRAELEIVSQSLPPQCCGDDQRSEIDDHLRVLWARRKALARQLRSSSSPQRVARARPASSS